MLINVKILWRFSCLILETKKPKSVSNFGLIHKKSGEDLISRGVTPQVSSAQRSLTTVFGMGTGGTSSLYSPHFLKVIVPSKLNNTMCLKTIWSSFRPISINQLNTLPCLHLWPINVVVSHGSYHNGGNLILRGASHLDAFSAYPFHT